MDALEYLKARNMLCKRISCNICPLRDKGCVDLEGRDPELIIETVIKLTDELDLLSPENTKRYKLKPCPFCGEHNSVVVHKGENNLYRVVCSYMELGCGASSGWRDNMVHAVDEWNRRAGDGKN